MSSYLSSEQCPYLRSVKTYLWVTHVGGLANDVRLDFKFLIRLVVVLLRIR